MHEVRDAVDAFAERVRSGEHRGATGKVLKNVVVVGIGGSSLGPAFLYEALKATPLYSRLGGREVPPTSRKAPRTHRVPHRTRNAPHAHRTRTAARTARTAHRCTRAPHTRTAHAHRTRAPHTRTAHAHQIRFLANIDEVDTARAIAQLDAAETLVVVTSKSFATRETLINACTLRQWLIEELSSGDDGISAAQITATHIAACTCVPEAASCWGIAPELAFPFWDWVGGRYSVTSCVGHLPIALAFGGGVFDEFLEGRPPQAERGRPGPVPLVPQLALPWPPGASLPGPWPCYALETRRWAARGPVGGCGAAVRPSQSPRFRRLPALQLSRDGHALHNGATRAQPADDDGAAGRVERKLPQPQDARRLPLLRGPVATALAHPAGRRVYACRAYRLQAGGIWLQALT